MPGAALGGEPPPDRFLVEFPADFQTIRRADNALAVAHQDFDPEFLLQQLDLLADSRLRGMQRVGRFCEIQTLPDGFAHIPELLKIHDA